MESQLSASEAGHLLRALERLEKLLVAAEAERMTPNHHQLMGEARGLCFAIGCRVMRLGGGAATVKDEWRLPSEPEWEISDHTDPDVFLELAVNLSTYPVMTREQRRSWAHGNVSLSSEKKILSAGTATKDEL